MSEFVYWSIVDVAKFSSGRYLHDMDTIHTFTHNLLCFWKIFLISNCLNVLCVVSVESNPHGMIHLRMIIHSEWYKYDETSTTYRNWICTSSFHSLLTGHCHPSRLHTKTMKWVQNSKQYHTTTDYILLVSLHQFKRKKFVEKAVSSPKRSLIRIAQLRLYETVETVKQKGNESDINLLSTCKQTCIQKWMQKENQWKPMEKPPHKLDALVEVQQFNQFQ